MPPLCKETDRASAVVAHTEYTSLVAWEDDPTTTTGSGITAPEVCNLPVRLSIFATLSSRLSHPLLHRQQKFEHYKATKTNNRCQVYIRHDTVKVSEVSSSPAAAHVETERNTHLGLHTKVKITRIFFFLGFYYFWMRYPFKERLNRLSAKRLKPGKEKTLQTDFSFLRKTPLIRCLVLRKIHPGAHL